LILRFSRQEPGLVVSGVMHAGLIVAGLVAFSSVAQFPSQEEAIAVDVVSESDLRSITKGEKTAKEVQPDPKPRVDKLAELKEDNPEGDAKRDVPVPPSRPRDVELADKVAAVQPEQQKIEPQKQEREPDLKSEQPAEEAIPDPPKRPPPQKVEEKPKPVEKKAEPKPDPKQLAKLIDQTKPEEKAKVKPAEPERKFNISDIKALLETKDKQQSSGSKGHELNRTAALGLPNASAAKMSLSQLDGLNALVKECILDRWQAPPPTGPLGFKLQVRMSLNRDGTLLSRPEVVNTSSNPSFAAWSSSLVRAIYKCAPFKIPNQYDAFYSEWRDWNVVFDPKDIQG
jgi:colicin import membrane protein